MNDSDSTNKRIGNYCLQQPLGKSDLSEVYAAEHINHHTLVAIKLLNGRWEGEDAKKFFAHMTTLTKLQHPHIIPILDFDIDNGIAFMVMKYAAKGTLRQQHPRGTRVPLPTIITYVDQITKALMYIHDQGLVHRDIKPHNLLMDEYDKIMLSDFGTAIISHSLNPNTNTVREFEGTVPYAAPEQLRGKPRRSSDQYSLGVMVYEWISGNWPFDGSFQEMTHQHLFVPASSFKDIGIACPENIEKAVLRTLEKDPSRRFPNVRTFAEELEWAYKIAQSRGELAQLEAQLSETSPPVFQALPITSQPKLQFKSPLPFTNKED